MYDLLLELLTYTEEELRVEGVSFESKQRTMVTCQHVLDAVCWILCFSIAREDLALQ
jgi:hypothetical protein